MNSDNDDVFGEECYGVFEDHGMVKDGSVNKIKTKGVGKTKIRLRSGKTIVVEEVEEKVKPSKEELLGAKMAEKKRKKEEAIAISKAAVALREKEAAEQKLIEDAKSSKLEAEQAAQATQAAEDDDWETRSF
jgi:hypothetical protein